jgi:hypothetical protein
MPSSKSPRTDSRASRGAELSGHAQEGKCMLHSELELTIVCGFADDPRTSEDVYGDRLGPRQSRLR